MTDVRPDGTKLSRVVIRVYPDRRNKEESASIQLDTFSDKIYFDVKEIYEEAEEKGFNINPADINHEHDGEIFGWNLAD